MRNPNPSTEEINMASTVVPSPFPRIPAPSRITKQWFALTVMVAACIFPSRAHGQFTPRAVGTATIDSLSPSCPSTAGWLAGGTCKHITISNCPNTQDLGVTVNYLPPSGTSSGTIIFFGGGAGTSANTPSGQEATFAAAYLLAGYGTVQTAWDDDWEGTDTDGDSGSDSILDAACRPATLMSMINSSSLFHPSGAMCAQGASAGGGGVAYALVWYGAKLYLNNAELLSGPPFSDIQQACKVPHVSDVTICGSGQYGCDNEYGNTSNWNNSPQFIDFYLASFQTWIGGGTAGSSSCNNSGGTTTSSSANTAWLDMSIVNPTGGDFDFKNYTSMAQWVCAGSASNYQTGTCGNAHCPNNSGSQGGIFGQVFSSTGYHPLHYAFTGINGCYQEEGVGGSVAYTPDGTLGSTAIQNDMQTYCKLPQ